MFNDQNYTITQMLQCKTLKAVLLAAGKGTRLFPISDFISKQMMPIAGKFLLEYIIEDLVESIKNNSEQFIQKYLVYDVLLLDNINFFQQKAQDIMNIIDLFKKYYSSNKQMIFAGNIPPNNMKVIEQEFNRFDGNKILKLLPPTIETRIKIIENQLKDYDLKLSRKKISEIVGYTNDMRIIKGKIENLALV